MTRDWQWHGDGLTGLPITVTTAAIGSASGAGDNAWLDVQGSGISIVNSGVRPPRMQFAKAASTACDIRRPTHTVRTIGQETFYFTPPSSAVTSGGGIYTVRNGSAQCFRVAFLVVTHGTDPSDVSFRLLDANNSQIGAGNAASVAFGAGPVRVEVDWECKTTTTGEITLKTYNGDTNTQLGTTVTSTTANINTGYTQEIYGTETTSVDAYTFWMDDMMRGTSRSDGGAYVVSSNPPEVTVSISDTTPARTGGATITLVGAATTAVGSITATSWKSTPGHTATEAKFGTTAVSGNTRDIVLPYAKDDTTYSFTYSATNSSNQTTTGVLTVTVSGWPTFMYSSTGQFQAIIEDSIAAPAKPVMTLSTTGVGDTQLDVPWSLTLPGAYTASRVTGVQWFKRRTSDASEPWTATVAGTVNTAGTIRSGTVSATRLTNGVSYTITLTPVIDGLPDETLAQTITATPQQGVVSGGTKRYMGFYWSSKTYSKVVSDACGDVHPEAWTDYIQPGLPGTNGIDPASKNADGTQKTFTPGVGPASADPGVPYTTAGTHPSALMNAAGMNGDKRIGTYYRDMQPSSTQKFSGWDQTLIDDSIGRGQAIIMTYATWYTSAIKWIGLATDTNGNFVSGKTDPTISGSPVVTQAMWDWAADLQDRWIAKWKTNLYDKAAAGYPCWITITHEPDVGANRNSAPNWGSATATKPTNHPDAPKWFARWFDRFFIKVRAADARMKCCIWIGGGRSDGYMDTVFDNMNVAPDLITTDCYVNQDAWASALTNFGNDVKQFRSTPGAGTVGRHYDNYVRLSRLARTDTDGTAIAATPTGTYKQIPIGFTEQAMSFDNHTDQEVADYIEGTNHTGAMSIRESLKELDCLLAVWWSSGSGPNGSHDMMKTSSTGTYLYPKTLAAHGREMKRTDVKG